MEKIIRTAVLILAIPIVASAQDADHQYRGQGYGFYGIGGSLTNPNPYYHPVAQEGGFGGEGFLFKGLGMGGELSYVHWGPYGDQAWLPSVDVSYHKLGNRARAQIDPFALGGISVYVPTMHGARGDPAGDFGGGVNFWFQRHAAMRFEVRDTVNGDNSNFGPGNHYLSFRFGATFR
jgi:hypothetical protein